MSHMIRHHISVNHESSYLRVMQSDMKRVLFFFVDKFFFCARFEKFFLFQAHGKPFRKKRTSSTVAWWLLHKRGRPPRYLSQSHALA